MISLVSNKLPIATFIYCPLKNIFVYAFKNYGAFIVDTINNTSTKLSIKPSNLLKIIGSGGTKGIPEIYRQSILDNLKTNTERLFIGSAGIETIMLAKNEIQFIFHGRVTPWDHSPMDLITNEAGGCVYMAINKSKFNIKSKGSILTASNFQIWDNIRDMIIPSNNPYRKYINQLFFTMLNGLKAWSPAIISILLTFIFLGLVATQYIVSAISSDFIDLVF